jgi:hypothetical protein
MTAARMHEKKWQYRIIKDSPVSSGLGCSREKNPKMNIYKKIRNIYLEE